MKKVTIFLFLWLLSSANVQATNYFVKTPDDGGSDSNDGLTWQHAKATIQAAVAACIDSSDCILIKYGQYAISNPIALRSLRMTSDDGTHDSWETAVPDSAKCILHGNSCRIFVMGWGNAKATVRGLKITGGRAIDSTNDQAGMRGGGAFLVNGSLVLENCWITKNVASDSPGYIGLGGAMYISGVGNSIVDTIRFCRIDSNTAAEFSDGYAGAIMIRTGCFVVLSNNIFEGNIASMSGQEYGQAINNYSPTEIKNNVFFANERGSSSAYTILNFDGSANIEENIFDSNDLGSGYAVYSTVPITVKYNCFYNYSKTYSSNVTSVSEVRADPRFEGAEDGGFKLLPTSPCINAGNSAVAVPEGGEPRIDIGAYEFIRTEATNVTGVDDTLDNRVIPGTALSLASETGTIEAEIQQSLEAPPGIPGSVANIGKYWRVESIIGGKAKIRLHYTKGATASFVGVPTIYHHTGTAWESIPTQSEVSEGACSYVETKDYYSNYSLVTVADGDMSLPVQATELAACTVDGSVILSWRTQTEVDNSGFNILRQDPGASSFVLIAGWRTDGILRGLGTSTTGKAYSFTDTKVKTGSTYQYTIQSVSTDGRVQEMNTISVAVGLNTAKEFALYQNYPNPFNPTTTISYNLPDNTFVSLKVYDILGREVKTLVNEAKKGGRYEVQFDAGGLSSGVYFCRLKAGGYMAVKKMLMLK